MPSYEYHQFVEVILANGQHVTLGDSHRESVLITPFSSNNTIVVGGGAFDFVVDGGDGFNKIVLGNGAHDTFEATDLHDFQLTQYSPKPFGDTVTLGNGLGDSVLVTDSYGGNSFNLGNGVGDSVLVTGSDGGNSFNLGNGDGDTVSLLSPHAADPDTVKLGYGAHDYAALSTKGYGSFTVGVANISFGGLDATLDLSRTAGPSFAVPTTVAQTSISVTRLDVISGLVSGDHIVLDANHDALATAANLAGVLNRALFATGTYSGSTFTQSATGHDVLLTYDAHGTGFISVVLVGAAGDITGSTIHSGTITLG